MASIEDGMKMDWENYVRMRFLSYDSFGSLDASLGADKSFSILSTFDVFSSNVPLDPLAFETHTITVDTSEVISCPNLYCGSGFKSQNLWFISDSFGKWESYTFVIYFVSARDNKFRRCEINEMDETDKSSRTLTRMFCKDHVEIYSKITNSNNENVIITATNSNWRRTFKWLCLHRSVIFVTVSSYQISHCLLIPCKRNLNF